MKKIIFWNEILYLLNAALLISHEIDSAYWEEWVLFGIPGGIQIFIVLNFILVTAVLLGYRALLRRKLAGLIMALVLAGAGIFAFAIHTVFLLHGHLEFSLPVSLALLALILLVSLTQAAVAFYTLRPFGQAPIPPQPLS